MKVYRVVRKLTYTYVDEKTFRDDQRHWLTNLASTNQFGPNKHMTSEVEFQGEVDE